MWNTKNVLFNASGEVAPCDFAAAAKRGRGLATSEYRAPEGNGTVASDIYSFGKTLSVLSGVPHKDIDYESDPEFGKLAQKSGLIALASTMHSPSLSDRRPCSMKAVAAEIRRLGEFFV